MLLTYRDDTTGERVELSAADLGDWAARTASMLCVGYGLKAGDRVAVLLPPHWQTAAILLGAWSAGIKVSFRSWATAGLTTDDPEEPFDALFVTQARLDSWLETMPQAWHRFVVDSPAVPEGYHDYIAEAVRFPDAAPAYHWISETVEASPDGTTYGQWAGIARELAASMGLRTGDKLLVDGASPDQPAKWLLAPLIAGASIVVVANLQPESIDECRAAEGATHTL